MDYREMTRLAADPARVRATATLIMQIDGDNLAARMLSLLADLSKYDGLKPLTTRQLETLHSLKERASRRTRVGRYKADHLIKVASERCFDLLDEEAEAWLQGLLARGADIALSRTEWRRLLALCRTLEIIHNDEWVEFD